MKSIPFPNLTFCCGTGGVGKTTVSAALATRLTQSGVRTAVLTIDPSKRLRTALGLDARALGQIPIAACPGLTAVIPPHDRTFDALLEILTADDRSWLQRMRENFLYQTLSGEYSGAHEFLALVLLYDLIESGAYDHIVVDTPPAQNAVAFFQAPERMQKLFDEQIVQWVSQGMGAGISIFQKLLGQTFLGSAIEFFKMLESLQHGFKLRLDAARGWISKPETEFWLIATPSTGGPNAVAALSADLKKRGARLHRVVLNRSLSHLESFPPSLEVTLEARAWLDAQLTGERNQCEKMRTLGAGEILRLPEQSRDVHSWEDLQHVAQSFPRNCLRLSDS